MSAHGYAITAEILNDAGLAAATFQLDHVRTALIHQPPGVGKRLFRRLITLVRQINDAPGPTANPRNIRGMLHHVIHNHRHRGVISHDNHAQ